MKDSMSIDGGITDGQSSVEKTPPQGKKKEFRLKMLIPPGQKIPVGIAS
mgnify:CR=1 FL=1